MNIPVEHQYIDRDTGKVVSERLFGDRFLRWLYKSPWENRAWLINTLASSRISSVLSFINYDVPFASGAIGAGRFSSSIGMDLSECVENAVRLNSPRKLFERKIRYWEVRPMDDNPGAIVSPADSRILLGSFSEQSSLFLKRKFFDYDELLGVDKKKWLKIFQMGDFAVCRLTPEKYHYNHMPVSGIVLDIYSVPGQYHSCNPGPLVAMVTSFSKNMRIVTIIDTDVPGGTQVGCIAMIEIVALMIGTIEQCFSQYRYDSPLDVKEGMFLNKGQPKSLFRPGSSTTVLVFEKNRVQFSPDLLQNMMHSGATSRFSQGFGKPLVETDVRVRSTIGKAVRPATCNLSNGLGEEFICLTN